VKFSQEISRDPLLERIRERARQVCEAAEIDRTRQQVPPATATPGVASDQRSEGLLYGRESRQVYFGIGSLWRALHSEKRLSDALAKLVKRTAAGGVR
jgi:hypothetical protein